MWEITDSSDILTDSDKKFRFICRLTPAALLVVMHPSGEKYGCGKGWNITRESFPVENPVEIGENLLKSVDFSFSFHYTICNSTVFHSPNRLFNR